MSQLMRDFVDVTKKVINNLAIGKVVGGHVVGGGSNPQISIGSKRNVLPNRAVIVPDYFSKKTYPVTLTGSVQTSDGTYPVTVSGEVTIDNTLQSDERVYLLKFDEGQKFFVLGRGQVYTTEPQEDR